MHISKNWKSHHVINHLTFTSYMSLILLPCVHFVTGRWDLLRSTALILWVNHEVVDLSGNKPLYLISATWWNLCETPAEFEHCMNSKKKQPHNSLTNWKNCCVNWTQRQMIFNTYDSFYTYGNTYTSITSSFQKEENTELSLVSLYLFSVLLFFPLGVKKFRDNEVTHSLLFHSFVLQTVLKYFPTDSSSIRRQSVTRLRDKQTVPTVEFWKNLND